VGSTDTALYSWYASMQRHRIVALRGLDGTGNAPLPYGQFMNTMSLQDGGGYRSNWQIESFINLQHFASLAFGYTWLCAFGYNRYDQNYPIFFSSDTSTRGDVFPISQVFAMEQQANAQTLNLGNYFKRAVSTGVFYLPNSSNTVGPSGIASWTTRARESDDYLVAIDHYTGDPANGGIKATQFATGIVGYFRPLQTIRDQRLAFANGLHFMLVNGSVGSGTAASRTQWYRLTFDFTGSTNDSVLRLDRTTGKVVLMTLVPIPGQNQKYYLDVPLPGGTGDVFAFWDSSRKLPGMRARSTSIAPLATLLLQ
jgi:hypothetical protein